VCQSSRSAIVTSRRHGECGEPEQCRRHVAEDLRDMKRARPRVGIQEACTRVLYAKGEGWMFARSSGNVSITRDTFLWNILGRKTEESIIYSNTHPHRRVYRAISNVERVNLFQLSRLAGIKLSPARGLSLKDHLRQTFVHVTVQPLGFAGRETSRFAFDLL